MSPIFEYQCTNEKCECEIEKLRSVSEMSAPVKCEKCGGDMVKKMSLNEFHLKGKGWTNPAKVPSKIKKR